MQYSFIHSYYIISSLIPEIRVCSIFCLNTILSLTWRSEEPMQTFMQALEPRKFESFVTIVSVQANLVPFTS